jgi:hypothetical protein
VVKSLQATRDGRSSSASRFTLVGLACLIWTFGTMMHSAIQVLVLWAAAFVTLSLALVSLNIFYAVIDNDLTLRSVGQEAAIAGIASLVEGASVWLLVVFAPGAARALFIPALVVAIIYKLSHLEDWSRNDVLMFLMFQVVIGISGASLLFGHFKTAIIIMGLFAGILAIIASISRSL